MPYELRSKSKLPTKPSKKTEFSDTIVNIVKALAVVQLEEQLEDDLNIGIIVNSKDILIKQAMMQNPLKWQVSLRAEL